MVEQAVHQELGKKEDTPPGGLGVHKTRGQKHTFGKCPKIQCKFCGEMGHIKKLCEKFKKLKGSLKGKTDAKNSEEAHDILDVTDSMGRVEKVKKQREQKAATYPALLSTKMGAGRRSLGGAP